MSELNHRLDGPEEAPVLILGPSLGTTLDLWRPQLPALTGSWRTLRFDLPGHNGSPALHGSVADFADAVVDLLDGLGVGRAAYAGVSLGGAIGTSLALRYPDRLTSLALCCTSARFGDPGPWHERAARVRAGGLEPLTGMFLERWFTAGYAGPGVAAVRDMLRRIDPEGYAACCEALAGFDVRDRLGDVTAPTVIIAGAVDVATPLDHAEILAGGIPGAELVVVPGAHLAGLENPGPVTEALVRHVERTA
ncbi:alpha/beta fold hydrolase [Actinoallomurus soli]|uniref:alpha/beta fold hydrolase n=1 Tax=Actinoallomurus soli TaxID=2952535 RepID=UPI002093FB4B|nr:alpha/beta fold hydrolase [Actinoallomurus soli]MCO5969715.1 alpha/beta fold hydrolase [Actinoallomurus soli]